MAPDAIPEYLFTAEHAAGLLGVEPSAVEAAMASGALRSVVLSGERRVPIQALGEYVANIDQGDQA
jgi:hypothetical protein